MAGQLQSQTSSSPSRLESSPLLHRIVSQDDIDELYRIYPDLPKNHMSGCPACGKNKGYGVDGEVVLNGIAYTCNCHDQLQRHKHYLNAGIGATYQFISWQDFSNGDALDALQYAYGWVCSMAANVESGNGLFIWSNTNGNGKTSIGAFVLKECIMAGYKCYMTTFQNMLSSMKSGWKDAAYERWYRNKVDSAQVLLIDDLGKEMVDNSTFNKDFAKQTLDSLLRTRTQQGRPTLFTSNFAPGDMSQYYGISVMSLLKESTVGVCVKGGDYRSNHRDRAKGYRRIY